MSCVRFIIVVFIGLLCLGPVRAEEVLSDTDVELYTDIFALQQDGKFTAADKKIKQLENPLLTGYVLYDRFFKKGYWTKKNEISDWLKKYFELPVAPDVYALGQQKKATLPKTKPTAVFGRSAGTCSSVLRKDPIDSLYGNGFSYLGKSKRAKAKKQMRQIARYIGRGKTLSARRVLESDFVQDNFSRLDKDIVKTALAFSYFLDGMDAKALEMANAAAKRNGKKLPLAYWTAGLAYWRTGDYAHAADAFMATANHAKSNQLLKAGGAFWAARSLLKQGRYGEVGPYLEKAASYPRTFYGLLAMRALGQNLEHVWDTPAEANDDIEGEFSHPALERFYALKQINREDWAQKELGNLYLSADEDGKSILALISQKNGFADELKMVTGSVTLNDDSTMRYPAPNWTPINGWQVDKSLVYAFVRQESCFNARAKSKVGAIGLMQIMPATGKELAKRINTQWSLERAKQPEYNLALGQAYLKQLMNNPEIKNNLMYLAVAYNAGPGNLAKWKKRMKYAHDPLLFLESIPAKETRAFTERIMVNYWIYSSLMGQNLGSLDQTISGDFPIYRPDA